MLALIDGDIVCFRCAASAEGESEDWIAKARAKELMEQILHDTNATSWKVYLTCPDRELNFRRKIYPEYKANRDKQPTPRWLAACKDYLVSDWKAEVTWGYEADDALGVEQTKSLESGFDPEEPLTLNTIICSIDKDLKQIPGRHYNFVRKEFDEVSEIKGWHNFYEQLLIGDPADNIKGCPGIGRKKAPRVLEGCESENDMFEQVRNTYNDDEAMMLNGQLLYIWRELNDRWNLDRFTKQEMASPSESISLTPEVTTRFMEHG